MKILKVKKHWLGGETDVSLEAPEFENFGNRLEEMQHLADEANPTDPAEVEASTAKMMAHVQELQEQARKRHEAMPTGPKKAMDSMMLGMLEQMAKTAAQAKEESEQPDDEDDEGEVEESEEEKRNPHLLDLTLRGIKWNKDSEKMLQQFFADWPQLRSAVLRGVFEYYKGITRNSSNCTTTTKADSSSFQNRLRPKPSRKSSISKASICTRTGPWVSRAIAPGTKNMASACDSRTAK